MSMWWWGDPERPGEARQDPNRGLLEGRGELVCRLALTGAITYASAALHHALGYGWEELLGRQLETLVHPEDALCLGSASWAEALTSGDVLPVRLRHRSGHWVPLETVGTAILDALGTVEEVRLCVTDVSERAAAESDPQESRLEALGRLSAGLAHEINSPVQFVGDNARFLATAFDDLTELLDFYRSLVESPDAGDWADRRRSCRAAEEEVELEYLREEIPRAVGQTLEGIERISGIVRAMKTFSHPGHEEHLPVDLTEALQATITVARHHLDKVADLRLDLVDLPPVRCNVAELNQVFLNLLVNAADAVAETGNPGVITVRTTLEGTDVLIAISDTGCGIPEDVQQKLFEPFFTTKAVGRGSGQGLAMARGIVHGSHGGRIDLESTAGVGTTFTVRLPADGPAPGEPGESEGEPQPQRQPDRLPA